MATRFMRHPLTAGRIIEGQAYVVTSAHAKMHTLNAAAALLWDLAENGFTAQEATLALVLGFEVDEAVAGADLKICLDDLVARDILITEG